ncbi:hypothetical protein F5X96DRAFT_665755 [Biscogniauxia mediterranea]|nr:hypothetical protein F5X96DRAFT_665755 [Biscogniauxia mediterranea]
MPKGGSGLINNGGPVLFHGGAVGWFELNSQQYHFKSLTFASCATGILARHMFIGESIEGMGSFFMTDSVAARTGVTLVNTATSPQSSWGTCEWTTARSRRRPRQPGKSCSGADEAWGRQARDQPAGVPGRDGAGAYYRFAPPTYAEYGTDQVVNAIIDRSAAAAGDEVLFFPYGIYLVADTPAASSPTQPAPVPMVRVGDEGDVGVAQFSDMLFTVADVLPGCTLLEVNMAGANPGDVGFWNTHFRVRGANDSQAAAKCARSEPGRLQGGLHQQLVGLRQGAHSPHLAPSPWTTTTLLASDPDFSWCSSNLQPPPRPTGQCRMSAYQLVTGSADLRLYAGGFHIAEVGFSDYKRRTWDLLIY